LSEVRDWYSDTYETARCKRGLRVQSDTQQGETLVIAEGAGGYRVIPNRGKPMANKTNNLGLTFVKACSDLWAIHQRKCKEWQKGGSLVAWPTMKSLLMGIGYNLCRVYNCHDSRACGYKRCGILF
jgi:hypothetical protein